MVFIILRDIAEKINESYYYPIMTDEVTESSNPEQLVLCFQWADVDLYFHKDFAGINPIENIKFDTIVVVVKDIRTRSNIPLSYYDGASNMTGHKNGLGS